MGLNLLSRALKMGKCRSSEKHLVHRKSNLNDFHSSQSEMFLKDTDSQATDMNSRHSGKLNL